MRKDYFERLHQAERRQAEWQMLDAALAFHTRRRPSVWRRLRRALGAWLIALGTYLVEPSAGCACDTNFG